MKVMVIPDTQVKPGVPTEHIGWAARYAVDKLPDVILHLGDHWDMPSLSSYDKGKKSFEGRRVAADFAAGNEAMAAFWAPIREEQERRIYKKWNPRCIFLMGNHEYRIDRATELQPELDGLVGHDNLNLDGWEVHPFLSPVNIEGVLFCHYFTSGVMGRAVSSASALLRKNHMSCVMGHNQRREQAVEYRGDGKKLTALLCGAFYQHDEDYLSPIENAKTSRGIWMLHEVHDSTFDEHFISLDFLKRRYGK